MKHLICFCLAVFVSSLTNAQERYKAKKSQQFTVTDSSLFLKGKKAHRTGATMMIAGGSAFLLGAGLAFFAYYKGESTLYTVSGVLVFGGAATFLASIPFIVSGHSKMNKSRVGVAFQQTMLQQMPRLAYRIPSVGLLIRL